jgi:hypothetical protein
MLAFQARSGHGMGGGANVVGLNLTRGAYTPRICSLDGPRQRDWTQTTYWRFVSVVTNTLTLTPMRRKHFGGQRSVTRGSML